MICGMLHVGITAANLDRSAAFYRDILGFPYQRELMRSL